MVSVLAIGEGVSVLAMGEGGVREHKGIQNFCPIKFPTIGMYSVYLRVSWQPCTIDQSL